jgi:hypothetical protein
VLRTALKYSHESKITLLLLPEEGLSLSGTNALAE